MLIRPFPSNHFAMRGTLRIKVGTTAMVSAVQTSSICSVAGSSGRKPLALPISTSVNSPVLESAAAAKSDGLPESFSAFSTKKTTAPLSVRINALPARTSSH